MKQPRSAATPGRTGIPRTSEFRLQDVNTATTAPALMLKHVAAKHSVPNSTIQFLGQWDSSAYLLHTQTPRK